MNQDRTSWKEVVHSIHAAINKAPEMFDQALKDQVFLVLGLFEKCRLLGVPVEDDEYNRIISSMMDKLRDDEYKESLYLEDSITIVYYELRDLELVLRHVITHTENSQPDLLEQLEDETYKSTDAPHLSQVSRNIGRKLINRELPAEFGVIKIHILEQLEYLKNKQLPIKREETKTALNNDINYKKHPDFFEILKCPKNIQAFYFGRLEYVYVPIEGGRDIPIVRIAISSFNKHIGQPDESGIVTISHLPPLEEYARGFLVGYNASFIPFVDTPDARKERVMKAAWKDVKSFSMSHENGRVELEHLYEDGVYEGERYKAWEIIFENPEQFSNNNIGVPALGHESAVTPNTISDQILTKIYNACKDSNVFLTPEEMTFQVFSNMFDTNNSNPVLAIERGRKTCVYYVIKKLSESIKPEYSKSWINEMCVKFNFSVETFSKKWNVNSDSSTSSDDVRRFAESIDACFMN